MTAASHLGDKIPIFYDSVEHSVQAAMLFPRSEHRDASRIFVAWQLAHGDLQSIADERGGGDKVAAIARDAASFARLNAAVEERMQAGRRLGEVVVVLLAMVGDGNEAASIKTAIKYVEERNARFKGASRTQLYDDLGLLQPALHLWCNWTRRGRKGIRDRKDGDAFLGEAEVIRQQLINWNADRRQPMELAGLLSPYAGWEPDPTLMVHKLSLLPDGAPTRKPPGRHKRR